MDRPKQMYPQSEARRLTDQPCPRCGTNGRVTVEAPLLDGGAPGLDPDVGVKWLCESRTCQNHQGFYIEQQ